MWCVRTVCPENEINCHPCMKGYKYFYMDEHSYFYPQCDDGKIITNNLVDDADTNLVEKIQTKNKEADGMTAWQNVKLLQEEQIIEEVHKRPALWNFKLPLTERSLEAKKKLWEEVSASMNKCARINSNTNRVAQREHHEKIVGCTMIGCSFFAMHNLKTKL